MYLLELETKVIRRFPKISQSQRRLLLGLCFQLEEDRGRGLLRDCKIFGNLRITFVSISSCNVSKHDVPLCVCVPTCRSVGTPRSFEDLLDVPLLVGDLVHGDVHGAAAAVHHHVLASWDKENKLLKCGQVTKL